MAFASAPPPKQQRKRAALPLSEEGVQKKAKTEPPTLDSVFGNNTYLARFLADYLGGSSILGLHRTNQKWRGHANKWRRNQILSKRIAAALSPSIYGDGFLASIRASSAVVTGSFVLAAIEGVKWTPDDVDIWTSRQIRNAVELLPVERYLAAHAAATPRVYNSEKYLSGAYEYAIVVEDRVHLVQVIQPDSLMGPLHASISHLAECVHHITSTFDLNFLKNTFDGTTVTLHDTTALLTHSSRFNRMPGKALPDHYVGRVLKYLDRGFVITGFRVAEITTEGGFHLRECYMDNDLWTVLIDEQEAIQAVQVVAPGLRINSSYFFWGPQMRLADLLSAPSRLVRASADYQDRMTHCFGVYFGMCGPTSC